MENRRAYNLAKAQNYLWEVGLQSFSSPVLCSVFLLANGNLSIWVPLGKYDSLSTKLSASFYSLIKRDGRQKRDKNAVWGYQNGALIQQHTTSLLKAQFSNLQYLNPCFPLTVGEQGVPIILEKLSRLGREGVLSQAVPLNRTDCIFSLLEPGWLFCSPAAINSLCYEQLVPDPEKKPSYFQ